MSTVFSEDYEGGADGVTLTAGNSSYNTFTNTPTFSTTHAKVGTRSMKLDSDGVVTNDSARQDLGTAQSQRWMRRYFWLDTIPTTFTTMLRVRSSGTSQAQLRINSTGQLVLRDDISALSTTTTATVSAGAWFRVEWKVDDTGNTTEAKLFTGAAVDSPTATETISRAYTGGTFNEVLDTNAATSTGAVTLWVDAAVDDNAAYPGPATVTHAAAGAAASTSSASGSLTIPGATLSIAGVASSTSSAAGQTFIRTAAAGPYALAVISDGPVGWWRLNETAGTTAADSAGANPGTYLGAVALNQADLLRNEVDAAVRLSNVGISVLQYVRVLDNAAINPASVSVEALVQATAWNGDNHIAQKGDADDQYRLTRSGTSLVWDVAGHGTVTVPTPDTTRHHLLATYDAASGVLALYVDGNLAGTTAGTPGALAATVGNLRLGHKPSSLAITDGFHGVIDEVALYDRALSAAAALAHAQAALTATTTTTPGFAFGFTSAPFGTAAVVVPPPPPVTVAAGNRPVPIVEVGFATTPLVGGGLYLHWDDPVRGLWDEGLWAPDNVWTDVTPWLQSFTFTRGATRVEGPILRYEAGTASIVLSNLDGRFNPVNPAGPYVSAGRTQVRPMVPVRIRTSYAGVYYDQWRGFADGWQLNYLGPEHSSVTLTATDAQKVLTSHARTELPVAVGAGELPGARVNRILDSVGWPARDRLIETGQTRLAATTMGGDAWSELLLVQDTEIGEIFVDPSGKVVFRGRYSVLTRIPSITPQAVFGSDVSGGELYFADAVPQFDDDNVRNIMRITREGGVQQEVSDPASIVDFLEKTYERSGLLLQSDLEALDYGRYLLSQSKDAELRFGQIVVDPRAAPDDLFPQCFGRDYGDRVTIRKRDPNVPLIEQDVLIRGVTGEYGGTNRWRWTWTLQPADKANVLVWNSGRWDSGASWAW